MNSKYNRKIRDVIYQAIFVRTSVLAKYTCVCALHTLTDGLSTVPASAAPAFTPLVRQEELRQLCKAGRTRKEEERLKKTPPRISRRRLPLRIRKAGWKSRKRRGKYSIQVQGASTNVCRCEQVC